MEIKSDIQKELEAISPELVKILPGKKQPVPQQKNFFEALPEQLLHRIKLEETQKPLRRLFSGFTRIAIAASLTGLIVLAVYMYSSEKNADSINVNHELAAIPSEDLTQFLAEPATDYLPTVFAREIQQASTYELETYYHEKNF